MDPLDSRRSGTRRLRLVTAAVAGGALVGTGALTVVVAQAHPAAAAGATDGTTSGSTSVDQGPSRPGGFGHGSGGAHGSSGAS